ncbi:MAG: hypothetical protein D6822_00415 [Cyanobacteria bacterium J149]|nr:MAG: hypothetical protein D6822_00415 [Cyanobacteria bacterium J149]
MKNLQEKMKSWVKKRDRMLVEDYNRGLQIKELVKKYNLSTPRIYQIINKYK